MIQHSIESRNNKRTELGMPRYHHITRWVLFSSPALRIFPITISFCLGLGFALAQITLDESPENAKINRQRGLTMISEIKERLKEQYYDPTFHGINIDERFRAAQERIKGLDTNAQIFRVIAQAVLDLNDSHTIFIPPSHYNRTEYGFSLQMVGNICHVVNVKRGSDAEAQGLRDGDVAISVINIVPTRDTLWKLQYLLYTLEPEAAVKLTLQDAGGNPRSVFVRSRILTPKEQEHQREQRAKLEKSLPELKSNPFKCHQINDDLVACKLYTFLVEPGVVDKMMKEVGGHKKLILDLRGNGGGAIETEAHLIGYFFDHDVKIGTEVRKNKRKDRIAKSRGDRAFGGQLLVLVDSDSASASEIFARVMQIEKRAKVIGDVTAGKVMEGVFLNLASVRGVATVSVFGLELTVADLVMSDGQRLEGAGVVPDMALGPTSRALAEKTDPVLAYAISAFGTRVSAEDAGKYYFMRPVPEPSEQLDTSATAGE
jgi:C-terminal processing protease CtpA/Prc